MATTNVWPTVHGERAALVEDLAPLDEAGWSTPSLCHDWTVRDVVAHLAATAKISGGAFFPKLIAAGFSLPRMQAKDIARERGASGADALANLRAQVESSKHPPGPTDSWLGEVLIHGEDVRRPLGIAHRYPPAAVLQVLDFYKGSNLVIGAKRRVAGLRLQATDADWTHGEGPEVSGPALSLLLAMTGRHAAHAELGGEGLATLAARS